MLQWMEQHKVPLTLEAFVELNWGGAKQADDLSAEELQQVPPQLLDGSLEDGDAEGEAEGDDAEAADAEAAPEGEPGAYEGAKELPPEEPQGPKVVMEHGKEYEFEHHHPESGVAVRARGKLSRWGRDGATLIAKDGQEHKVPWASLSPQEKAEAKEDEEAKPKGKASSSGKVAKADRPVLVFRKSEGDFGSIAGVPAEVVGMAVAAQADAEAAQAAPQAAADGGGEATPAPVEPEAPEARGDGRVGYLSHAFRALKNFWTPKN